MKLIMTKKGELIPNSPDDKTALDKIKGGTILNCTKETGRSNPQISMLWSVAKVVTDNSEQFKMGRPAEVLMDLTKLELGHCHNFKINGVTKQVSKSISFAKMKPVEFNKFVSDAYELWSRMLGCSVLDLLEQGSNNA